MKLEYLSASTKPTLKMRASPSGIHLFNRLTGLNVLLDEVRVPSTLWANAPRHVSIALTNECDLKCHYCFAPKKTAILNYKCLLRWLSELDENGCLGIGFGGGEPTLYPKLAELCAYAAQKTGLAVTLATHAHNFDDNLIDSLIGCVHFVRVSMDGIGSTYEALRGRPFRIFCNRLKYVQSLAPFGINYVVNSRTLPDLDDAVKFAADTGAVEFLLLPELPTRYSSGIDDHTTEALQQWVANYRGSIALTVSEAGSEGLPTCNPQIHDTGLHAYAHIDALGTLKRFSYCDDGVSINDDGIMHALKKLRSNYTEEPL